LFESKYFKLGITVVIATVIANLLLFIVASWNTPSQEEYLQMQEEYSKNVANLQIQTRERIQQKIKQQIELQSAQADTNNQKKQYWHVNQDNYNDIQRQRREERTRLNEKRSEERALKAEKNRVARQLANERARAKSESKRLLLKSVRATNNETCSYWRKQYENNKSDYNKTYRDSACLRAASD